MSGTWDRDAAGAFVEELFAKHHGEIYAYLLRMLRDPELAADLTQDAFVKAYKTTTPSRSPRTPGPGCTRSPIASRSTRSAAARSSASSRGPASRAAPRRPPSTSSWTPTCRATSSARSTKIPERQRAALLLAELHDLTGLELAAALGVSHVAARALLTRARESLRQALAAERAAEADGGITAPGDQR